MPAAILPRATGAAASSKKQPANRRPPNGTWRAWPSNWRKAPAQNSREGCVAFYLLDEGLPELEKRVRRRLPVARTAAAIPVPASDAVVSRAVSPHSPQVLLGAFLFAAHCTRVQLHRRCSCFWESSRSFRPANSRLYLVQMLLTWFVPPRVLPKMSFEEGIPDDCRTLVVVPMMLLTPDSIRGEIEKLEVRYLANPLPNLCFSLLADFTDAEEREMPEDDDLLGLAMKGIEQLNARHGNGRFILFHQARVVVRDRAPLDRMGAETRETGGAQPFPEWRGLSDISARRNAAGQESAT